MTDWGEGFSQGLGDRVYMVEKDGLCNAARQQIKLNAVRDGVTSRLLDRSGTHSNVNAMHDAIKCLGGRLSWFRELSDGTHSHEYVWPDGHMDFSCNPSTGHCFVFLETSSKELYDKAHEICRSLEGLDQPGAIKVFIKTGTGYELRHAAFAGVELERGNYTDDVLERFDRAARELQCKEPSGRLLLLDGEPGTGKTYLLRALLAGLNAVNVLTPAEMLHDLDGPQMIASLLDASHEGHPINLIVEDADYCLIPRGVDNMSAIRSLLNYTDGMLGAAVNLRVLATTNAKIEEVDPALRREGRLLDHIAVTSLDKAKACEVLDRLVPGADTDPVRGSMTLASAYAEARKQGWRKAA